jgi:hypothetical protein
VTNLWITRVLLETYQQSYPKKSKNKKSRYRNQRLLRSKFLIDCSSSKINLTQGALQRCNYFLRRQAWVAASNFRGNQRRSPALNDSLLGEP